MINNIPVKKTFLFLLSTSIIFSYSCTKNDILVSDLSQDYSYFPLQNGHWSEFEVDSIVHYDSDDYTEMDTAIGVFHFFIREEIDSSFIDDENQKTYIIQRFRRDYDSLPWSFMNVWTATMNPYSAQRVEDNIRFVRLKFPITSQSHWPGNDYNFFNEEEYFYEDLYQPKQYGSLYFDSTLTVIQNDFISYINRVYKKEVYGNHAGLLFKEIDSVNTKNTANGTIILNGLEYKFNIVAYKN